MELGQTGLAPRKGQGPAHPALLLCPVPRTAGLPAGGARRPAFLRPLTSYERHTRTAPAPASGSWALGKGRGGAPVWPRVPGPAPQARAFPSGSQLIVGAERLPPSASGRSGAGEVWELPSLVAWSPRSPKRPLVVPGVGNPWLQSVGGWVLGEQPRAPF